MKDNEEVAKELYYYLIGEHFEDDVMLRDVESSQVMYRIRLLVEMLHLKMLQPRDVTFFTD